MTLCLGGGVVSLVLTPDVRLRTRKHPRRPGGVGRGIRRGARAWTAILAGALWAARRGRPWTWKVLRSKLFLVPLAIALSLHFIWNSSLNTSLGNIGAAALALAGLTVMLSYVAAGREQYDDTPEPAQTVG